MKTRELLPEQETLVSPEQEKRHHLIIGIHGGIGVGKTKLAELIDKRCGLTRFEEGYRQNPFLKKFYKDPKSWSFQSQSFFIKDVFRQMAQMPEDKPVIMDPTYWQHKEIFAWVHYHRMKWMTEWDYQTYLLLCEELEKISSIPKPDIIVSVHAPAEVILGRIKRRAQEEDREFELEMLAENPDYFKWIAHRVEQWARENPYNLPIIVVDSDELNYVYNATDAYMVTNQVQEEVFVYLGGREDIILPFAFAPGPVRDSRAGRVSKMDNPLRR